MKAKPVTSSEHKVIELSSDMERYDTLQHEAALEGIDRGELAVVEGCVVSHAQAKDRLTRWLK